VDKHVLAFTPFSAGARNCIGQNFFWPEAKIALARIIQKFDFKLSPGQTIIPTTTSGTTKAKHGLYMTFIEK